jgi:DNA gyrase inhibitor GyrI
MKQLGYSATLAVVLLALCAGAAGATEPSAPTPPPAATTVAAEVPAAMKRMPNLAGEVKLETLAPVTFLTLPVKGSYAQHSAAISKLMGYVMPKGIMLGAPLALYYDDPEKVPADSLRWAICVPVAPETKVEAPFVLLNMSETQAAVVGCTGPYEGTTPCYGVLTAWLQKNGYALAGPVQEHWLSDPSTPPEKRQSRIVFPVKKVPTRQP